ncbi:MAG: type II CRISPR RNA-guided endonuclease Cas9 [Humidesulfovibrio sp.]|nr:type II CRISPR RNA-guided endonuclease Cas9 [Humidesulfovibrio sp.]
MQALIGHGLMPPDERERKGLEAADPYALRAKGITTRLELFQLGRALFHLNQRRGFRSNRKTDKNAEAGKIHPAIQRLKALMQEAGTRTIGAYLHVRKVEGHSVRARLQGAGARAQYDFYPERVLMEQEFNLLWSTQAQFHPRLTTAAREELHGIIFHQRSLKPVQPGRCTLEPPKERASLALPVAQHFRIFQEVNQLRVITPELHERPLTPSERDTIAGILLSGKDLAFDSMRGKLKLAPGHAFNLEGASRDRLKKDITAALLSKKEHFGPGWFQLSAEQQERLVLLLLEEENEDLLLQTLMDDWGLPESQSRALAALDLPNGYSRLCRDALTNVTAQLRAEVIPYSEAVVRAGYVSHSDFSTGEIHDRLPYYAIVLQRHVGFGTNHPADRLEARYGRITNPTVHVALNQVRRVVNELIKDYGHPQQIILEVARDLKNGLQARKEIQKRQEEQRKANDRRRQDLEGLGESVSAENLMRLRLWEELAASPAERRCPYTGEPLSMRQVLSSEVEIEHILPFARTLDDSPANKTICLRRANRYKSNNTPFEAFGASADGYSWTSILERAALMPANKRKRFSEDALLRYEEEGDFLDRQLVDTQYISRITKGYLCSVCDPRQVWVTPGRLTFLLARNWGLPRKNRDDHRHHAQDAAVIGVTDRAILQKAARQSALNIEQAASRILTGLEEPWPGFRGELSTQLDQIIVSHKADHGVAGRLHNDTAYGVLGENGTLHNAQHRIPAASLTEPAHLLAVKGIGLRAQMLRAVSDLPLAQCRAGLIEVAGLCEKEAKARIKSLVQTPDKAFAQKLLDFCARRSIRRVRILETLSLIPIQDKQGKVYKGFKGDSNAYYAIHLGADGKWIGEIISTFEANGPGPQGSQTLQKLPLVARLFRNDMLAISENGAQRFYYVVKISEGKIVLAEHCEANLRKRVEAKTFTYTTRSPAALQKTRACPISVSPIGKVRYLEVPGHATEDRGDCGR